MGSALDLEDYYPSVLLHCWLGHLTCKIVSEMTSNVSSGTLNPTIPYHTFIIRLKDRLQQSADYWIYYLLFGAVHASAITPPKVNRFE